MTLDESMAAICRRANDLHARVIRLLAMATDAAAQVKRRARVIERQEREERDEAAIEAVTTMAGRM